MPAQPFAEVTGSVATFDDARGLGTVHADDGVVLDFHCTAIADGSRTIAGRSGRAVHGRGGTARTLGSRPHRGALTRRTGPATRRPSRPTDASGRGGAGVAGAGPGTPRRTRAGAGRAPGAARARPRRAATRAPRPPRRVRRWRCGRRRAGARAGRGAGRRARRTAAPAGPPPARPGRPAAARGRPRPGGRTPRRPPAPRASARDRARPRRAAGRERRAAARRRRRSAARDVLGRPRPNGRPDARPKESRGCSCGFDASRPRTRPFTVWLWTPSESLVPCTGQLQGSGVARAVGPGSVPPPGHGSCVRVRSVARALPIADVGFPRRPFVVFHQANGYRVDEISKQPRVRRCLRIDEE